MSGRQGIYNWLQEYDSATAAANAEVLINISEEDEAGISVVRVGVWNMILRRVTDAGEVMDKLAYGAPEEEAESVGLGYVLEFLRDARSDPEEFAGFVSSIQGYALEIIAREQSE